jgi:hypothetical protein
MVGPAAAPAASFEVVFSLDVVVESLGNFLGFLGRFFQLRNGPIFQWRVLRAPFPIATRCFKTVRIRDHNAPPMFPMSPIMFRYVSRSLDSPRRGHLPGLNMPNDPKPHPPGAVCDPAKWDVASSAHGRARVCLCALLCFCLCNDPAADKLVRGLAHRSRLDLGEDSADRFPDCLHFSAAAAVCRSRPANRPSIGFTGQGAAVDALAVAVEHRAEQNYDKRLFGPDYVDHHLVFCQPDGACYPPDKMGPRVKELMRSGWKASASNRSAIPLRANS